MSTQQEQQNHIEELNNELTIRREKLAAIREQGIAFPNDFRRDAISSDLHKLYDDKTNEELIENNFINCMMIKLTKS
jgi:Lysyl-tRNA synthetase (class II)